MFLQRCSAILFPELAEAEELELELTKECRTYKLSPMQTPKKEPTPMLKQYMDIKRQYPDCFLFYRMGDFYEMFFEDAVLAAPILEVQLTSRDKSATDPIPMCGVPHHAVTHYIEKIIAAGKKVAICEQLEDPSVAKGIVKRDVVRVITPSLVADPELVPEQTTNILISVSENENKFEVAYIDLLASRVVSGNIETIEALIDLFLQLQPKELLINNENDSKDWIKKVRRYFPHLLISKREKNNLSISGLLQSYIKETQKTDALKNLFVKPEPLEKKSRMRLDATTLNSLEVTQSISNSNNGPTLLSIMDRTVTPMGRRLLKEWLSAPLYNKEQVEQRLDSVDQFWVKPAILDTVRNTLKSVRDLERLSTKAALGLAMPKDLVVIRETLKQIPTLKSALSKCKPKRIVELHKNLNSLTKLVSTLDSALLDQPANGLKEGGIFKDSFNDDIKKLRKLKSDAQSVVDQLETRERKKTGISSLKVKYSKVFGFTIEVTHSNLTKVPKHYTRKQTIANGERFVTTELKELEEKIETSEFKLNQLEERLFLELRQEVSKHSSQMLLNSKILAELDVFQSFATIANEKNFVKPEITGSWDLKIEEGRHPVVESLLPIGEFIPNDLSFVSDESRTWLITGPNMSGKSTVMRQVALIVILAQAGSFVPAKSAMIPLIDSIFTRIGSADDLAHGRSTFMVEMTEMARILQSASERSMILIDEVGRGTSTYDGLSLAMSLLEFIHKDVKAKTLFSTHFIELTSLEKKFPYLKNANVLVRNWNGEIIFLHKLVPGICTKSYGVEVARLAGLPPKVLLRAESILKHLETPTQSLDPKGGEASKTSTTQLEFLTEKKPSESRSRIEI